MKKILYSFCVLFIITSTCGCKKNNNAPEEKPEQPEVVIDTTRKDSLSKIIIQLSGMKNAKGNVNVALYNSSSSFNNPQSAYQKYSFTTVSGNMTMTLEDIPKGTYAFGLFHDENSNNEIDKNILSIPKEGFGFSNNAIGSFGPPTFDQSKFELPAKSILTQIIVLKFY